MKKRSIKVRVICLIVAAMTLGGAVTVAAVLGSPYETLKNAAFDALTYRNATVEGSMTVTVDGVPQLGGMSSKFHYVNGDNSTLSYYFDEDGEQSGFYYASEGLNIWQSFNAESGRVWYNAGISPVNQYSAYSARMRNGFAMFSPEDRDSAQMRFMELALDALVGDLKNNITMTSENGVRTVSGTLTENQVPELAKAGLDMIAEQTGRYYYNSRDVSFDGREHIYESISVERGVKNVTAWKETVRAMTAEEQEAWDDGTLYPRNSDEQDFWGVTYINDRNYILVSEPELVNQYSAPVVRADFQGRDPLDIPMRSITVNYVHGEAQIGANGDLQYVDLNGKATVTNIFGDTHEVELKCSARFSDIGTSDPACPIPGAQQLLTSEYAKTNFGSEYTSVYFTLNKDGSIDATSVTTTYPGELDKPLGVSSASSRIRFSSGSGVYSSYAYPAYPASVEVSTVTIIEEGGIG